MAAGARIAARKFLLQAVIRFVFGNAIYLGTLSTDATTPATPVAGYTFTTRRGGTEAATVGTIPVDARLITITTGVRDLAVTMVKHI
jgi:hypothetical protein